MRAAVLQATGDDKLDVVDDIEPIGPGPGEVLVRVAASGVCHSDLSAMDGTLPMPAPCVLGHEGAGEVLAVGDNVSAVSVGDHVIVSWTPPCGTCVECLGGQAHLCAMGLAGGAVPRFRQGARTLAGFAGTGTFAEQLVVPEAGAIPIPADVPLDVAALVGCGVTTGVGAAIKTAQVRPGSSVVVFGCGGVGISVIQGARLAGAAEIVAVDVVEQKLETAKGFGATHGATPGQLPEVSAEVTGGRGFDYSFEVIGRPETIRAAYEAARRGGTVIVVGAGRLDEQVAFTPFELFFNEKVLKGCVYGSADVRTDFHRLLRLWRAGRLDLEGMITRRIGLDGINDALVAMQRGEVVRTIIEY